MIMLHIQGTVTADQRDSPAGFEEMRGPIVEGPWLGPEELTRGCVQPTKTNRGASGKMAEK